MSVLCFSQLPEFALYVKEAQGKEKQLLVTVQEVLLKGCSEDDVEVWSSAHKAIFSKILSIVPPSLSDVHLTAFDKSYLVVPVVVKQIGPLGTVVKATVDVDTIAVLDRLMHKVDFISLDTKSSLRDHLFTVDHRRNESKAGVLELYELVQVDDSVTPLSPFPDPNYASFKQYFKSKYDYELQDDRQKGLRCHRFSVLYLKLITPRLPIASDKMNMNTVPLEGKDSDIILFPELIKIHPLSANLWRLMRCIPSLLWRLESFLLGGEIVSLLSLKAWMGKSSSDQNRVWLTDATLDSYNRATIFPPSKAVCLPIEFPAMIEAGMSCKLPQEGLFARGPDAGLILPALTPTGANDSVSLEQLEVLGDSLLKLVSSVYLFTSRESDNEGKLSSARQRRVSNLNLYRLACAKHLPEKILASDFIMAPDASGPLDRIRWIPPGFRLSSSLSDFPSSVPEEQKHTLAKEVVSYLYNQISDKSVADVVEGLIGAYTVAGGIEAGIRFMKWLGIRLGEPCSASDYSKQNYKQAVSSSILTSSSSEIFQEHFGVPAEMECSKTRLISNGDDYVRMLTQVAPVQKKLLYRFDNHALLIQALSHPSYIKNRHTSCYQNLEFLGDAILDYLITCHVFTHENSTAPKKISSFRSAVVNNRAFAQLSVDLGLYKHMLHSSPQLFKRIEQFVTLRREEQEGTCGQALLDETEVRPVAYLSPQ